MFIWWETKSTRRACRLANFVHIREILTLFLSNSVGMLVIVAQLFLYQGPFIQDLSTVCCIDDVGIRHRCGKY